MCGLQNCPERLDDRKNNSTDLTGTEKGVYYSFFKEQAMITANKNSKPVFGLLFLILLLVLVLLQQLISVRGRAQNAAMMIAELQKKLKKSEEKLDQVDRRNAELTVRNNDQKHYITEMDDKYFRATNELEKKRSVFQKCLEETNTLRSKIKEMQGSKDINKDQAEAPNPKQEDQIINLQARLQEMQDICSYIDINPEQARKLCSAKNPGVVNN